MVSATASAICSRTLGPSEPCATAPFRLSKPSSAAGDWAATRNTLGMVPKLFCTASSSSLALPCAEAGSRAGIRDTGDLLADCAITDRWRLMTVRKMRYLGHRFNWLELTISVAFDGIIVWTVSTPGPSSSRSRNGAASPTRRGISADRLRR
ncbi:hypothetical protein DF3PB_850003 [uncultured Defluviicoccus sp.]|uniref:Uncharacterized protein n=1 Tax=metagenome TaxID=256318 RepID=A0A380TM16_9ZZZZ|nr:hypothetical protein DF3PB_850003 [uncultured Defluviicoccus sp.]